MNDPILEALNFALENDLQIDNVRREQLIPVPSTSSTSGDPLYNRKSTTLSNLSSSSNNSNKILPSELILGEINQHSQTPCPILGCSSWSTSLKSSSQPSSSLTTKDDFLAHLLTQHYLVIDDVDKIANLHK